MNHQASLRCDDHPDPFDCPDNLIFYSEKFDEYGIIIHDGGASFNGISFCPWCGTKLPNSKRDQWFDELEALGFDNPTEQSIPERYLTNEWYKA